MPEVLTERVRRYQPQHATALFAVHHGFSPQPMGYLPPEGDAHSFRWPSFCFVALHFSSCNHDDADPSTIMVSICLVAAMTICLVAAMTSHAFVCAVRRSGLTFCGMRAGCGQGMAGCKTRLRRLPPTSASSHIEATKAALAKEHGADLRRRTRRR